MTGRAWSAVAALGKTSSPASAANQRLVAKIANDRPEHTGRLDRVTTKAGSSRPSQSDAMRGYGLWKDRAGIKDLLLPRPRQVILE